MGSPPSVAQTTSWPTPPRSRAPWPEARSSESAALRSHPCTTGTAAPEPKRSDDPPHAPWFVSPTHGASAYLHPQSQKIPCRLHQPEPVSDRTHGLQFKADVLKATPPTGVEGIERYLASGQMRGIGPAMAKRLVAAFGESTFEIIEASPERLTEVAGIGA